MPTVPAPEALQETRAFPLHICASQFTDEWSAVSGSTEQYEDTTDEDDFGQQELLEFDDEVDESPKISTNSHSAGSSSNISAKRTFDEFELEDAPASPPSSPGTLH